MRTLLLISVVAVLAGANETRGGPIFAFGLPHQALGQAELLVKPSGDLIITNIGDSGEDGVRIDVNNVRGLHNISMPAVFPLGAQVTTKTIGITEDNTIQTVATLRVELFAEGLVLFPDFSSIGSPTFTVRVFLDGELVAEEGGISGIAATLPSPNGNLVWEDCYHAVEQTVHFALPDPVGLPSGKQVIGDFLAIEAENPQITVVGVQAIEITAADTSDLLIDGEWIILFDDRIPHRALGSARFQPTDGQLIVSELADASADGVRFDFIDFIVATQAGQGFEAHIEGVALDAPGRALALSARGTVNGVEDVPLGTASLDSVDGVVAQVLADYEPLGSELVRVEMYDDGAFVGDLTVLGGGVVGTLAPAPPHPSIHVHRCEKQAPGTPSDPPCFVFGFDHPVVFEPGTLVGDELRLLAADAPFPIDSLQSFDLTSSVGEITIVDANILGSCEGDANGDGAVDPLDSGFILARFGCPVGTGDPSCDAADQNGDGAVDPLDSGFVLARFGPCESPPGVCEDVNAGGCAPAGNTLQIGITGELSHSCGGPVDEWVSLAYPIYDTNAGDTIHAINVTHNSNSDVGSLYLMADHLGCPDLAPDINNILWTGDGVIAGNGTGSATRYCIAAADGGPILSPGGTLWVVAAFHSSFSFDVAFDCVDSGAPGQGFANPGGDATDCVNWVDLDLIAHGVGDPCAKGGTFGGCALVSVESGDACDDCDAILDSCSAPLAPPDGNARPGDVEPGVLSTEKD